ncbi:MAG: TIGR01212 family radical SAM protein [Muribaculaceae bacterium]|nr:TIGR01212 family radical SAM protein [Muribaculaceae bacterium]
MNPWYTDYSEYLSRIFPGVKVQKISVDAGRSCPNRDGTIGTGGCSYCDNRTFTPGYCRPSLPVAEQLALGKAFFSRKYPLMKYLAYFQSYTFTHRASASEMKRMLAEAAATDGVVGLVIGTRPDCFDASVASLLGKTAGSMPVFVEFGAESSFDATLRRVNRGHTWRDTVSAVALAADAGLHCGLHLIAGLPGETLGDALTTVDRAASLPIESVKLHQLQIIKGTPLWREWKEGTADIRIPELDEYLAFCAEAVRIVDRRVAIERFVSQAPAGMLEAPKWGLKNHEFTARLHRLLSEK